MADSCSPQRTSYDNRMPVTSNTYMINSATESFKTESKYKYSEFKKKLSKVGPCTRWSDLHNNPNINKENLTILVEFREQLKTFIYDKLCNGNECKDVGSTEPTSDVNVSITSTKKDTSDIAASYSTLLSIHSFIVSVFSDIDIFKDKGKTSLYKILRFFDINFYLTNFKPERITNSKTSNSMPILSSNYTTISENNNNILSQYFYAFYELFQLKESELNRCKIYNKMYNEMYNEHIAGRNYEEMVSNIDTALKGTSDDNKIIDLVSLLSTFENECYHTQGSYYHVVLGLQMGTHMDFDLDVKCNMLAASAIENLCYAYIHRSNYTKYINRVFDAVKSFDSIDKSPDIARRVKSLNSIDKIPDITSRVKSVDSIDKSSYIASRVKSVDSIDKSPDIASRIFACIKTLQSNIKSSEIEEIEEIEKTLLELLKITIPLQTGGMLKLQKMKNKEGLIIKKYINEKERVIYVDNTRKQYVKHKNAYIPISKFRAMTKKH